MSQQLWTRPDGAGGVHRAELLVDDQGAVLISAETLGRYLTELGWARVEDPAGEKREFRVTFGQQYARETHPTFAAAHPDGWATIMACCELDARKVALARFGRAWSGMYDLAEDPSGWDVWYPLGQLLLISDDVEVETPRVPA